MRPLPKARVQSPTPTKKKDFLEGSVSSRKPFQMDTPQHGMSLPNPPLWPTSKPQPH